MKTLLTFVFWVAFLQVSAQSTQINPNNIAVPNVTNLADISTPQAGMLVYNKTDNALYYRNNTTWVNLNAATTATNSGGMYYKVTGYNGASPFPFEITTGVHQGTSPAYGFEQDINYDAFPIFTLTKNVDAGSMNFRRTSWDNYGIGVYRGLPQTFLEVFFYDANDVLYLSIKVGISQIQMYSIAPPCENCVKITEKIKIIPLTIGYKDWPRNTLGTYTFPGVTAGGWTATY